MDEILDNSYFKNTIKDKYSFPKSNRFPQIKPKSQAAYLDSSSVISKRSTSFGYGSKYDVFKERQRSPGPFQYQIQQKMKNSQTISFGVGRDKVKANSYIDPQKIKTPHSGKYQDQSLSFRKRQRSCLITGRNPIDSFIKISNIPEAGKYNPNDSFYSRKKRSAQFAFGSSKRFDYGKEKKEAGPGSYELPSKLKTQHGSFGKAVRKTYAIEQLEKSISPGPKYVVR